MDCSNATTTMAPSTVISSQRNSVQRGWDRVRDRDERILGSERDRVLERGRERAETESLYSCESNNQGMVEDQDQEKDRNREEDEREREKVASTGKYSLRTTPH